MVSEPTATWPSAFFMVQIKNAIVATGVIRVLATKRCLNECGENHSAGSWTAQKIIKHMNWKVVMFLLLIVSLILVSKSLPKMAFSINWTVCEPIYVCTPNQMTAMTTRLITIQTEK